jgi:uncharacterized protein YbjT (DUF2867 family)
MNNTSALLVGGSGLIGGHCLDLLLGSERYEQVILIGRRPLGRSHPKLREQVVNFDEIAALPETRRATDIFCCLGTTIKVAGSPEAFRRVDYHYPLELAKWGARHGAQQFLLVSALGANAESTIFYNRVKGELEAALAALSFPGLHFFRPSLLLGERQESRPGEKVGQLLMGLLNGLFLGPLRKYRAIPAATVATAMVRVAQMGQGGVNIYESDRIQAIADQA